MSKDKRFVNFLLVALALIALNSYIVNWMQPKKPAQQAAADAKPGDKPADEPAPGDAAKPAEDTKPAAEQSDTPPAEGTPAESPAEEAVAEDTNDPPAEVEAVVDAEPPQPLKLATIGSVDPKGEYRLLVTLTSKGAGVHRVELAGQYFDIEDRSGYLGQLDLVDSTTTPGALVRVVGAGTPAALAGVQAGDIITTIGDDKVVSVLGFSELLAKTSPHDTVVLRLERGGEAKQVQVKLTRRPLEVLSPVDLAVHSNIPPVQNRPSLLMSLEQLDAARRDAKHDELEGTALREENWELVASEPAHVAFRRTLKKEGLEIVRHYRLEKTATKEDAPAIDRMNYHLTLDIELKNVGTASRKVSYALEGPNGLPIEGWWYAMKVGKPYAASKGIGDHFSGIGLRDVVVGILNGRFVNYSLVRNLDIVNGELDPAWQSPPPLEYIGVDAQYFSSVLFPLRAEGEADWVSSSQPVRVGPIPADPARKNLTNVSGRITTQPIELAAGAAPVVHHYRLFAGPKRPEVVEAYKLDPLIYYGWYEAVSVVLVKALHFFHDYMVFNYGLAIILLTVVVRSALFPLSRKQAINMQKMQTLQPEIKRLQELYKNKPEQMMKAQRELFAKAKYNPLAGCLPMLIQIPIFLGLYRALAVDVQLRDAPLISHSIRWASNLAAPDKLIDWSTWMPALIQSQLGPYFNILPLATVGLFLWQQKMFMPPPTDEQQAMQQKIMKYMMVFMGFMFFKVPSGLCIYFIASSTWGILERKFLPKSLPAGGAGPAPPTAGKPVLPSSPPSNGNGRSGGSKPKKSKRH